MRQIDTDPSKFGTDAPMRGRSRRPRIVAVAALVCAVGLGLAGCAQTDLVNSANGANALSFPPGPVDRGGLLASYIAAVAENGGKRHVIDGTCMSGCTAWLGAAGACVTDRAVLWFHAVTRDSDPVEPDADLISREGNTALLGLYPPRVRATVAPWMRDVALSAAHTLSGVQLQRMGVASCAAYRPQPL